MNRCFHSGIVAMVALLIGFGGEGWTNDDLRELAKANFAALESPKADDLQSGKVKLGRALFWDQRISANGQTSCASCHLKEDGGADRRPFSVRDSGKLTGRNSQTVFNAALQPKLRWLADRRSAAHQAERSITGSLGQPSPEAAVARLKELGYDERFEAVFAQSDEPVSVENFGLAIEAYEQTLVTPAAFDRFLTGDDEALSENQKLGLRRFIDVGCADCHSGKLLGGEGLEKFGLHKDYWLSTQSDPIDDGLFSVTENEDDKHRFRVAMLRNIAQTAPYFHDGSVKELERAVDVMAEVQIGMQLTQEDRRAIVAFLESLSGAAPANYSPPQD